MPSVETRMDLETVTQGEASQKEKNKHCIIEWTLENDTDECICKAEAEGQM